MLQQIHLQDCFILGHGFHGELLSADNLKFLFRSLRCKRHLFCTGGADKGILPQAAGQSRLIFPDLALNGSHSGINRGKHIRCTLAGAEPGIGGMDCQLHLVAVFHHRKSDKCLRVTVKVAIQLRYFLLCISVNVFGKANLFLTELKFHIASLLSYHRSTGLV